MVLFLNNLMHWFKILLIGLSTINSLVTIRKSTTSGSVVFTAIVNAFIVLVIFYYL